MPMFPIHDHLRQPSHRHPGFPFGMDDGPSPRRQRPRPQSGLPQRGLSREPAEEGRGLHPLRHEEPRADGPAHEGDSLHGPHSPVPGHDDPVRQGPGAGGAAQGRRQRRLHPDIGAHREGQDRMEVRPGGLRAGEGHFLPREEVRPPLQGGFRVDRHMHIQLHGHVRQAGRPRRVRGSPPRHPRRGGRLPPHGVTRRRRIRHDALALLPQAGLLRVRHISARMPGPQGPDVPRHPLRGSAVQAQGEVLLRQEHRHRRVQDVRPRMRILLCGAFLLGEVRDQAVLLRFRDAVGLRHPQGQGGGAERPRSLPDRRLLPIQDL